MIAEPDLLEKLLETFEFNPKIGSATGLVKPLFEETPPKWVSKYLHNHWLSLTEQGRKEHLIISEENCGVFSCHQAIKRRVFFDSGGFNPENTDGVWVGDGETGLNLKIQELGYYFAYNSSSVIHHMIPPHRTTLSYLISRVGNQAYCDSYTEYRRHRSYLKHVFGILKRNSFGLVRIYTGLTVKLAKDQISAIFLFAYIFYIKNRFIYDIKVLLKPSFRRIIEIDNWLEVDDELEMKI
jgi:glucosyl-dolichyl phosphate glucuronosyltransferase